MLLMVCKIIISYEYLVIDITGNSILIKNMYLDEYPCIVKSLIKCYNN